jgi:Ser/Thr protein kinase RdoA (MazF antagonist)
MTEAEEAARCWGGTPGRLIAARENHVHELTLGNGARAALRLHRTAYQSASGIRAEIDWCARLSEAGLPVARPLPSVEGALLVRLSTGRHASACAWIDGTPLGATGRPLVHPRADQIAHYRRLGRLMADIHAATDASPPHPFPRPDWGIDGLTGEAPVWGRFWDHPSATAEDRAVLRAARDFLRDQLQDLGSKGADTGPIHADLMRENVLVNGRSLSLLDFDDCGTGFRLYDLGTAMVQNEDEPARDAIRDALVEGYAEIGRADAATVDLMTLARGCASVGWTVPRLAPADPIHRSHIARALRIARRVMGQNGT